MVRTIHLLSLILNLKQDSYQVVWKSSKSENVCLSVDILFSCCTCNSFITYNLFSWPIVNSVLNKGKSAIPPLFNGPEVLASAYDKTRLFAENVSKNSSLDGSSISLLVFLSRTNLKLHNISVTSMMVKMVVINLDLSEASGPSCIPIMIPKNCEPELSYILAELFTTCLKKSCFPNCWKVSSVVPVFKNVGERSTAKTTTLLVFFLWLVKSLKNF